MRGENLKQRVKTARGRKNSSTRWLERQLNDPYVAAAKRNGWRSRAAYKLIEVDDKQNLLKPGMRIVDLGAAPGGWSQVAAQRVEADKGRGHVVAIDYLDFDPIPGVASLKLDFLAPEAADKLKELLGGEADGVFTDMAAPTTGHRNTDHIRTAALFEEALYFAQDVLKPGGFFLGKVFQGGTDHTTLHDMKKVFRSVKHVKPKASRQESVELYVLAQGFRGRPSDDAQNGDEES